MIASRLQPTSRLSCVVEYSASIDQASDAIDQAHHSKSVIAMAFPGPGTGLPRPAQPATIITAAKVAAPPKTNERANVQALDGRSAR